MAEKSFEKAMTDLEAIVEKLEKGGQTLNESLKLFENGVKLARYLREELEKAESRIEILLKNEKGETHTEPYELADGDNESAGGKDEEPDEDDELPF